MAKVEVEIAEEVKKRKSWHLNEETGEYEYQRRNEDEPVIKITCSAVRGMMRYHCMTAKQVFDLVERKYYEGLS